MAQSTYLRNKILDAVVNATSFSVAQVYVSLHTGDPGATGASEVAGGSYIRKAASFGAASGGSAALDAAVEFSGMPSCTVTHVGFWDAESSGNFLQGGALTAQKVVAAGDTFRFAVGALTDSQS